MDLTESHLFSYVETMRDVFICALLTGNKNNLLVLITNFHFGMLQMITVLHLNEIMMEVIE